MIRLFDSVQPVERMKAPVWEPSFLGLSGGGLGGALLESNRESVVAEDEPSGGPGIHPVGVTGIDLGRAAAGFRNHGWMSARNWRRRSGVGGVGIVMSVVIGIVAMPTMLVVAMPMTPNRLG